VLPSSGFSLVPAWIEPSLGVALVLFILLDIPVPAAHGGLSSIAKYQSGCLQLSAVDSKIG
jgi:hypothetical protein